MATRDILRAQSFEEAFAAGRAALDESRFEDATNYFRAALKRGGWSGEDEARVRCHLADSLEKRGLYVEQLDAVAKYERPHEIERLPERMRMEVLIRLGWGYSFNNDLPRAIALFNQAIQIARQLEDPAGMGACYFGLGRAYRNISEIRIARDHYTSALEHFRRTGDWRRLAESYINIGYMHSYEGDFRNGLHLLKQALTIIGTNEEHDLLGRTHMYLAVTYDNLGSTTKALESFKKSIDYFRASGNQFSLAINQNNYADKLTGLGRWAEAEALLEEALATFEATRQVAHYAGVLDTLAYLHLLQGKLDEADELSRRSLEVIQTSKNTLWVEINTRMTMGRSLMFRGRYQEAKEVLEMAVEVCHRSNSTRFFADAHLLLADALLALGDIEQAALEVDRVRDFLNEQPSMMAWGLMMRLTAKVQAACGHVAAAIQSLGQSSSVYELRGNVYDGAINRLLRAQLYEQQERLDAAINEARVALAAFTQLGAAYDGARARAYLQALEAQAEPLDEVQVGREMAALSFPVAGLRFEWKESARSTTVDLASGLDGFVAQRLVQATHARELLLHEVVAIVREQARSRAAVLAEIVADDFSLKNRLTLKAAAAVGLDDTELAEELEKMANLRAEDYPRHFVYRLGNNQPTKYLLRIVWPTAERFTNNTVTLAPLLQIAEQGLEAIALRSKNRRTQVFNPSRLLAQVELPGFVCNSRAMSQVLEQIYKIRSSDVTVLITGESGTGKELIARAVHAGSSRRANRFLPFNCSAAPKEMIESQLFGYRKGAFTGAIASNEGVIRAAERGTLFLDEIGDLPLELQPKLLRFLQEGEIHPIGDTAPQKVDVRVVAATNSNLERAVAEGRFREDLFHRLNVIRVQVPNLRQRREEIPALINYYLDLYQKEAAKSEIHLAEETLDLLVVYDWPGNVRQLCNEVRRIVAYNDTATVVTPESLSPEIAKAGHDSAAAQPPARKVAEAAVSTPEGMTLGEAVEELERQMIAEALRRSAGNIARAAKELGLSRKGLYLKMDRLDFKI
ncbi:MAG TPA: sigma 54-interacting transcriptional regulator [Blastocatellia bacterium]|nr:sigma 54-interacting transcriptional regulator [Blastocatellia bacterium]